MIRPVPRKAAMVRASTLCPPSMRHCLGSPPARVPRPAATMMIAVSVTFRSVCPAVIRPAHIGNARPSRIRKAMRPRIRHNVIRHDTPWRFGCLFSLARLGPRQMHKD